MIHTFWITTRIRIAIEHHWQCEIMCGKTHCMIDSFLGYVYHHNFQCSVFQDRQKNDYEWMEWLLLQETHSWRNHNFTSIQCTLSDPDQIHLLLVSFLFGARIHMAKLYHVLYKIWVL